MDSFQVRELLMCVLRDTGIRFAVKKDHLRSYMEMGGKGPRIALFFPGEKNWIRVEVFRRLRRDEFGSDLHGWIAEANNDPDLRHGAEQWIHFHAMSDRWFRYLGAVAAIRKNEEGGVSYGELRGRILDFFRILGEKWPL